MRQSISKRRFRWTSSFACCLAALVVIAASPDRVQAAGMLIADGGSGGVLEIKEHAAHVTINNGIAVTEVTQVFQNMEDRQVEALYTFPVPRGASVANFSMWINGTEMVGEVVEKKRAREIYDSYKQRKRDPGLLEQTDYRTFEMRIFPIAPRAEQRVQIVYYQELEFDNDRATYVYPLATNTREKFAASQTTGRFAVNLDVKSEIPIVALESPSHTNDFAIAKHADAYQQASLEATGGNLNRDVVITYQVARPKTGVDLITSKQPNEDGYFCLTLTAGEELPEQATAMDYVFVLDISGSMLNDGKLDLSRKSLGAFVSALGAEDRFEVIAFNVQPTPAFGEIRNADETAKADAEKFLAQQRARGGTVLNPAISTAYKYASKDRPLNVIVLSDGMTEQTERNELARLIRERPEGSRVFCIGVGNDVNRALLEQMANDSGGLAGFISPEDNFDRQATAFRRKLLRPVATDLKIDFDGIDVYDLEPRQLPNLYHGMPVRLYGRYKGSGEAKAKVSANVMGRALDQAVDVSLPKRDDANPQIERMWAWHRVDRLLKQADAGGSCASVIDEIVRLGEGYSIVTEYTSFIVLETDAEFQRWQIDRKNSLRLDRDRAAQAELAQRLETLRNRATAELGPVTSTNQPASLKPAQFAQNAVDPQVNAPVSPSPAPSSTGRDLSIPSSDGGGAIDPITGIVLIVVGGAGVIYRRRTCRAA